MIYLFYFILFYFIFFFFLAFPLPSQRRAVPTAVGGARSSSPVVQRHVITARQSARLPAGVPETAPTRRWR